VSVLVIGNGFGLKFSKPDDKHVNANGEKLFGAAFDLRFKLQWKNLILQSDTVCFFGRISEDW
jgi:hypothetical protein